MIIGVQGTVCTQDLIRIEHVSRGVWEMTSSEAHTLIVSKGGNVEEAQNQIAADLELWSDGDIPGPEVHVSMLDGGTFVSLVLGDI